MTTHSLRRGGLETLSIAAVVASSALLLGTVAGTDARTAVALVVAAAFAAVTLWRPLAGVLLLIVAIPVENMLIVAQGVTALKAAGAAVFAMWALRKIATGESWKHLVENGFFYVAAAFVLLVFLSIIWATNTRVAQVGAYQLVMLFAFSVLIVDLVRTWGKLDLVVRVMVVGGLVAAAFTVGQALGGARRAGNMIAGDPNATAVLLVSLIPFGFYLFRASSSRLWRLLGGGFVGLAAVAVATTYSRMNLLILPPILLILLWQTFRDGRNRGWLAVLVAGGALIGAAVVPWDRVMQRAETIVPYLQSSVATGEEVPLEYSGRGYHLRIGLEIAKDYPVLGVGYNNYGEYFRSEYQYVVGGVTRIYTSRRSPHSSHIGILADLGGLGMLLWFLLIGISLWSGWRAWAAFRHRKCSPQFIFAQCFLVAMLVYVVAYGWYLPTQKEKLFWLLLGLAAVLPVLLPEREENRKDPLHPIAG